MVVKVWVLVSDLGLNLTLLYRWSCDRDLISYIVGDSLSQMGILPQTSQMDGTPLDGRLLEVGRILPLNPDLV